MNQKVLILSMISLLIPVAAFSQTAVDPGKMSRPDYSRISDTKVIAISECRLHHGGYNQTFANSAYVMVTILDRVTNTSSSYRQNLGLIEWNQFTYPPRNRESFPLQQCREGRRDLVLRVQATQPDFVDRFDQDIFGR